MKGTVSNIMTDVTIPEIRPNVITVFLISHASSAPRHYPRGSEPVVILFHDFEAKSQESCVRVTRLPELTTSGGHREISPNRFATSTACVRRLTCSFPNRRPA